MQDSSARGKRPAVPAKSGAKASRKPRSKAESPRVRADEGQLSTQELGARLRAARDAKGLSLVQLTKLSGVPGPTISRIENNKMSPTFGILSRLMMGLDIDWTELVRAKQLASGERLASFALADGGVQTQVRESQATVMHSHDAAHLMPLMVDVRYRNLEQVGGLIGHKGEEFCLVLSGTLVLHMEGRPPTTMKAGASALFDSSIPHAYLAATAAGARIVIVVLRAYGSAPGLQLLPQV